MRSDSLESLLELCDEVNLRPGSCAEFYFDKNPDNFNMILDMYRLGRFHIVETGITIRYDYYTIDLLCVLKTYLTRMCHGDAERF